MKQLPKAIRDLQGDLWVPAELADLLERVLRDSRALEDSEHRQCLRELENLMGFSDRRDLPTAREQLGLPDARRDRLASNLLKA
ncbi:MAG TPA: hypothetical protein VHA82_19350 [Ramlibacter sp.]|uniref:hypothetical protein n=1 Tax=Ramlibacter sp. TaxID=1917967 RepID=UPI002D17310E|nr:hypothetical protein [Ramlibacter sp.]HVZ45973.1 hypothetical protein [Ramlibacter sp.]